MLAGSGEAQPYRRISNHFIASLKGSQACWSVANQAVDRLRKASFGPAIASGSGVAPLVNRLAFAYVSCAGARAGGRRSRAPTLMMNGMPPPQTPLRTVTALRYVQPLREGGSLPAVVDTDDGLHVVKFRGAGQGARALIAELIFGTLADSLGLPTPALALVDLPEPFGRSEPDPEIQDILRRSHGLNVGFRYLDGAFNFALAAAGHFAEPALASRIVWLDALLTNPDRTHRNPNMLVWERRIWLIDHGAALYAHHDWPSVDAERTRSTFSLVREHVLLRLADAIEAADAELAPLVDDGLIEAVLGRVPDSLLLDPVARSEFPDARAARERYATYLRERLRPPRAFVAEAIAARERLLATPPLRLEARR